MVDERPGRPRPLIAAEDGRYYGDEVSMRQLYLVLRSGLPLIIVIALLAGAIAFGVTSLRPDGYEATATVNVIPPFVGTDSLSGLELSVTAGIDAQSYQEIAYSAELLAEVGEQFGYGANEVFNLISLEARPAPSQARGHLVIDHVATVTGDIGLTRADDLANAWATATVAVVADALSSHLSGAVMTVAAEIEERRAAYQAASDAWAQFLAHDERSLLRDRLARLADDESSSPNEVAELRARLAALEAEAATLERQLSTASLVYYRVAPTGPALELQRDLVSGSVFVAIPASTPVKAATPSRLVVTLAAVIVAALAATLLVFMRAAVKER